MTPSPIPQPVLDADSPAVPGREMWWRRSIAGPAALALLIAGGAGLIRVAILAAQSQGEMHHSMIYTAAVCVMAGVALVLVALPKIVAGEGRRAEPMPATDG